MNSAHSNGVVTAGVQFGSVIRGMEGNFSRNIRAAEAFGSTLSFLTPVVEAAFPIVGAATLGYALFEMGKHAYEAWENIVNLKSAIEGLNQLQIKVDADHGKALDTQEAAVESILAKTQGQSASLTQKYSYQSNKGLDLSDYFYSDQFKKLPDDVKGTFEETYKNVAPQDAKARIESITATIKKLQDAIAGVKDGSIGAFLPVINGAGPSSTRKPPPLLSGAAYGSAADSRRVGRSKRHSHCNPAINADGCCGSAGRGCEEGSNGGEGGRGEGG